MVATKSHRVRGETCYWDKTQRPFWTAQSRCASTKGGSGAASSSSAHHHCSRVAWVDCGVPGWWPVARGGLREKLNDAQSKVLPRPILRCPPADARAAIPPRFTSIDPRRVLPRPPPRFTSTHFADARLPAIPPPLHANHERSSFPRGAPNAATTTRISTTKSILPWSLSAPHRRAKTTS